MAKETMIEIGVDLGRTKSFSLHGISRTYGGIGYAFDRRNFGTLAVGLLIHEAELVEIMNIAYAKGQTDAQKALRVAMGLSPIAN